MKILRRPPSMQLVAAGALLLSFGCGNGGDDGGGKAGANSGGTGNAAATGGTTGGAGGAGTGGSSAGTPSGGSSGDGAAGGPGGSGAGGLGAGGAGAAGAAGNAGGPAAGSGGAPTWGVETRPTGQTCKPPASPSAQAMLLSETGCVDPADPTKPAATLIAYDVATPLWSDGAEKRRYFALPDDGVIHVKDCTNAAAPDCQAPSSGGNYEDEGDWDFPDKTIFVKTFGYSGKLVETRLLVRLNSDNWFGYSYKWKEDQSDAELLTDGADQMVEGPDGMLNWHYPSRAECFQCHGNATGVSLGPETSQLNFEFTYPNGVKANQLDTLKHVGIFEAAPPDLPVFPRPADTTHTVEERARAYIHMNCGMCHRPGGSFTDWDGRYGTALADMQLCGKPAEKAVPDKFGLTNPVRLDPGHPDSSVMSLRMHELEVTTFRMPQIGTRVVDPVGTEVVDAWITSLTACP